MDVPLPQEACLHQTQADAGYDLPCLQWDASKFSMTGRDSTFVVGIVAGRDFMKQQVLAVNHQGKSGDYGSILENKPTQTGHCP